MEIETIKSKLTYMMFKALYQKEKINDKDIFICDFMDILDKFEIEDTNQIIADKLLTPQKSEEIIQIME